MKIKKYDEIINDIMADIHSGVLKPHEKLPTNNALAEKYNTSGVTVRKSIAALINRGYLESTKRVGTFVKKREKEIYLLSFSPYTSINEEITSKSIESITLTLIKMHHTKKDFKAI
ncbi:MAG: GntR family transcriptional regulator, partial [Eubacterium sp.]